MRSVRQAEIQWPLITQFLTLRVVGSAARSEGQLSAPVEWEQQREEIEAALRSLPAPQRQVLVMRIWGELTFAQVAESLEISPNTAASRYRYALENMRSQLREETVS